MPYQMRTEPSSVPLTGPYAVLIAVPEEGAAFSTVSFCDACCVPQPASARPSAAAAPPESLTNDLRVSPALFSMLSPLHLYGQPEHQANRHKKLPGGSRMHQMA
jgi:hypothetical protein